MLLIGIRSGVSRRARSIGRTFFIGTKLWNNIGPNASDPHSRQACEAFASDEIAFDQKQHRLRISAAPPHLRSGVASITSSFSETAEARSCSSGNEPGNARLHNRIEPDSRVDPLTNFIHGFVGKSRDIEIFLDVAGACRCG
jgi:hypothetical protein